MTAEELRKKYEEETGKKWWTNPVCHGQLAFASWDYQEWFERRLIALSEGKPSYEGELYSPAFNAAAFAEYADLRHWPWTPEDTKELQKFMEHVQDGMRFEILSLRQKIAALSETQGPNFWLCSGIAPSGSELYAGTYDPELAKKWAESNFVFPCIRVKEGK